MKKIIKTKIELNWLIANYYLESIGNLCDLMTDDEFVKRFHELENYVEEKIFVKKSHDIVDMYAIAEYQKK
ncbi:MAG: hypothetical protein FWE22_04040 [Firmicutes bacterium]|nr:hypothetical protein [Bacillota bacterium]